MVIALGTEISGGISRPSPGAIVKLTGIRTPVLGATGRGWGTWPCFVRETSGGRPLLAAVVVELLAAVVVELGNVALDGVELGAVALDGVEVGAGALDGVELGAVALEAGEDPPQAARSSDASSIAVASGAMAPG